MFLWVSSVERAFEMNWLYILGMSELVKERPADPVEWLAAYLLRNNPNRQMHTNSGTNIGGPSQVF